MRVQNSLISSKQFFTLICLLPFHQLVAAGEDVLSYKMEVDTTFKLTNVETTKMKVSGNILIGTKGTKKWIYNEAKMAYDAMLQDVDIMVENKKLGGSFSLKLCETYRPLKAALAESFWLLYTEKGDRMGQFEIAMMPKSDPNIAANVKFMAGVAVQVISGMLNKYKKENELRDTTSEMRFIGLTPVHYRGPTPKEDGFSFKTKYYVNSAQKPFYEGYQDEEKVSGVCNRQYNYTEHDSLGSTEVKLGKDDSWNVKSKTYNDIFKYYPYKETETMMDIEQKFSLKMLDTSPSISIPPFKEDKSTDQMSSLRYTDVNKCILNYKGDIYNLNRMYKALACNRVLLNFALAVFEQATFCLNRRNKKGLPVKVGASGSAKV